MDIEGVLAITLIFGGGTLFLLSVSPIGKAFADRIRAKTNELAPPDPHVLAELDELRTQVAELHERVDFAERLLAERREAPQLPGT
jgi:Tfp pilus assembly protein PilO